MLFKGYVNRGDKGRLVLQYLDTEILIWDMFAECKDEHEIEWLQGHLQDILENISEERLREIEEK